MHRNCLPYEQGRPLPQDLVDVATVMEMTGLSRTDAYRRVQKGDFGRVVRLGEVKGVRVSAGVVEEWLRNRVEA